MMPADVPGYSEAVEALDRALADNESWACQNIHLDDVRRIAATVMAVSRPYVQAELLADMADDLALMGGDQAAALILDDISYTIREHLDGR